MHDEPTNSDPSDSKPTARPRRPSPLRRVLAAAVFLTGLVWILQGLGILTAGRSFMIGDPTWVVIGAAFVVLGVVLGIRALRQAA